MEEFRRSEMRRIDFCREKGLSVSTLARHLRKSKKQDRPYKSRIMTISNLVPVKIAKDKRSLRKSDSRLAVVLSGGRRVEVQANFDVPTLGRLLIALERV